MHHTTESSSAVYITSRIQVIKSFLKTPWCASHCGFRLRGVNTSAESSSTVCIIPWSLTPRSASHPKVNNLPSVCFDPMFYKCYFSVMSEDIILKIILEVTNCIRNLYFLQKFFKKTEFKGVTHTKTRKKDIFEEV